jgi:uncharacterized SAM-binding protein YcdF (DUF218 family)
VSHPNHSKHIRWLVYLSVCLLLTITVVISGRGVGRWLVREDKLSSADVIVVLSGGMPYRAGARNLGEPAGRSCRRLAEIRHPVC